MVGPESSPPQPIMSGRGILNGALTEVVFTSDGMLRWTDVKQRWLTMEKEVLGFEIQGDKIRIKALVENRDGICCFRSTEDLVRKDFVFEPLTTDSQKLWCQHLRDYLDSLGRPKTLFIFVNPYGGKKKASKIFLNVVRPLLEDAGIQMIVQETKHRLHAKEVASTLNLAKFDGIVCVSGDGTLVEVVNGLLGRQDWSTAIKMPLGIIPGADKKYVRIQVQEMVW
uniref:Uncharacterized protein MANES_16G021200 n=1 Tax=Rhizophora mucronata TaxID=61149 RepID=A0A2P2JMY3_RHIMU